MAVCVARFRPSYAYGALRERSGRGHVVKQCLLAMGCLQMLPRRIIIGVVVYGLLRVRDIRVCLFQSILVCLADLGLLLGNLADKGLIVGCDRGRDCLGIMDNHDSSGVVV